MPDSPNLSIDWHFDFPVSGNCSTGVKNLQNHIITNVLGEEYIDFQTISDAIESALANKVKEYHETNSEWCNDNSVPAVLNFSSTLNLNIRFNEKDVVSYKIEGDEYLGGAHGLPFVTGHVFSFSFGEVLYENLFDERREESIIALIKKHFNDEKEFDSLEEMIEDRCITDFDHLPVSKNCYISKSGVTFLYGAYEIACYAGGMFEITVPFSELKPFVLPDNPLQDIFSH